MSAHVLLNLLNEFGKRDKMRGLPSILSLFRNECSIFIEFIKRVWEKRQTARLADHLINSIIQKHECFPILQILLHGVISLPDGTSYIKLDFMSFMPANVSNAQPLVY